MNEIAVVLGVLLLLAVAGAVPWAVVREVRADGYGHRPPASDHDWGSAGVPSAPYSSASCSTAYSSARW